MVTCSNSGNVHNNAELIDGKSLLATMFGRTLWVDSRHWVFIRYIHEQGSAKIIVRYTAGFASRSNDVGFSLADKIKIRSGNIRCTRRTTCHSGQQKDAHDFKDGDRKSTRLNSSH